MINQTNFLELRETPTIASGESFVVTNVITKETTFAHPLDSLPIWSVGGNKNKLLAIVTHGSEATEKLSEPEEEPCETKGVPTPHGAAVYKISFFKCDGDAKLVAEALHKACMNTRKAIRTSSGNSPLASKGKMKTKALSTTFNRRSAQSTQSSKNSGCHCAFLSNRREQKLTDSFAPSSHWTVRSMEITSLTPSLYNFNFSWNEKKIQFIFNS